MINQEASQAIDKFLEELLSTREGTDLYLQCLLRAIRESCSPKKCKQIADTHLEFLKQEIQEEEDG